MLYFSHASGLVISLAGVFFWHAAGGPLPWLLGPLLAMLGGRLLGLPLASIRHSRELGQAIVGLALGLTFSHTALLRTVALAPWIALAVVFAFLLAWLAMQLLRRLCPGLDPLTAWLVSLPGGASEMTAIGSRRGAKSEWIVLGQSLRVLIVVLLYPGAFALFGHSTAPFATTLAPLGSSALPWLLPALALGVLLQWRRIPNPWFIGPLTISLLLASSGTLSGSLPAGWVELAQLLIGIALGVRFDRQQMLAAPRFLVAFLASLALLLLLAVAGACLLSMVAGLPPALAVLAMAPGGITEMCLTARAMGLDVPTIIAFQLCRLVMVLLLAEPLSRWLVAQPAKC
ncbi:MAG: AbrB family transcriptional regulator [Vogesella sp.]|uniref:AbrB family transcriptional regulator n=1 Tax=Vogesella sp. TaxID=1904252 RepID=UPI003F2E063D